MCVTPQFISARLLQLLRNREGLGREFRGTWKFVQVMNTLSMLIMVIASQVYTYIDIYQIVHFNYIYTIYRYISTQVFKIVKQKLEESVKVNLVDN